MSREWLPQVDGHAARYAEEAKKGRTGE